MNIDWIAQTMLKVASHAHIQLDKSIFMHPSSSVAHPYPVLDVQLHRRSGTCAVVWRCAHRLQQPGWFWMCPSNHPLAEEHRKVSRFFEILVKTLGAGAPNNMPMRKHIPSTSPSNHRPLLPL